MVFTKWKWITLFIKISTKTDRRRWMSISLHFVSMAIYIFTTCTFENISDIKNTPASCFKTAQEVIRLHIHSRIQTHLVLSHNMHLIKPPSKLFQDSFRCYHDYYIHTHIQTHSITQHLFDQTCSFIPSNSTKSDL